MKESGASEMHPTIELHEVRARFDCQCRVTCSAAGADVRNTLREMRIAPAFQ